ncbi:hypothetical protein K491DRAFT_684051 [Lophiostoma macrostomum CBS 122681]|uniref:Lysine-specific metallo-endopeptidase domain-containing protein n=1 Tax=Lophiostoma macrostomum CBS 122681 TaxID=1314788 RepID=A0A6A6SSM7_9PLEO|nr:hypothetical protein K491DRAFT_684051 [Lophiostoma macrostomum CBS 122681]
MVPCIGWLLFVFVFPTLIRAISSIQDVFTIERGVQNSDLGSCGRMYTRKDVNDALKKVFDDSSDGQRVRTNLQGWFGLAFDKSTRQLVNTRYGPARLRRITTNFNDIQILLNGRLELGYRGLNLYCNTDWFQKTTKVYDSAGTVQMKTDASGAQVELSVHDLADFNGKDANGQAIPISLSRPTENGANDGWKLHAYWVPQFKHYFYYETAYPGPEPAHFCNLDALALTDDYALYNENIMTLNFCPRAFNEDCSGEQSGGCFDAIVESSRARKLGDQVQLRQPGSLTMLHELVHVVAGPQKTPDDIRGQEIYGANVVLQFAMGGKDDLSMKPDAYSFFAYALWLGTVKDTNDLTTPLYDWSSGIARLAQP